MSLPPGFLDELRNRVSISSVVGRKVTWDMRKSNVAKGDYWAPCPFHQEKSASFHVDDRKGYYYCFGCHAKGDALGFLRETENMSFMEAVETLAREAGMTMPARDPRAAQKADRLSELAEVMEGAARFYRMQLSTGAAAQARDYLAGRGLGQPTQERFEIGFAPASRHALWAHLTGAGVSRDKIIEAGLAIAPDDGSAPYDRFRGRIMFPIRDARGRLIAFGGRAMDPNAQAKYLNSPETPLFDKGRSLYNAGPARSASGKHPLLVAEGYMDVIALVSAGFEAAVAPLGTAITEEQLRMIWRLSPEPIIALDGDTAGLRAGYRLIDLALPHLGPDQSLRFCLLPGGMDPDDVLRSSGAGAMRKLIEGAVPLVQLLWQRETEGQVFDSPENRESLRLRLSKASNLISDTNLRKQYRQEIEKRLNRFFWTLDNPRKKNGKTQLAEQGPTPNAKLSRVVLGASVSDANQIKEEIAVALLMSEKTMHTIFLHHLERLHFSSRIAGRVVEHLLASTTDNATFDEFLDLPHIRSSPLLASHDYDKKLECVRDAFESMLASQGLEIELREAAEDLHDLADEGLTWRLRQATEMRNRAERSRLSDSTDLGEDRAALAGQLDKLIESQVWVKRKK